jgi:hypothetical protein
MVDYVLCDAINLKNDQEFHYEITLESLSRLA